MQDPEDLKPTLPKLRMFVQIVEAYGDEEELRAGRIEGRKLDRIAKDLKHSRTALEGCIEDLEKLYNVPLAEIEDAEKAGRRVVTANGLLLYRWAKRLLRLHDHLKEWPPGGSEVVRIGSGNAVVRSFLAPHLARLLKAPQSGSVRIDVVDLASGRMRRHLRQGRIHLLVEAVEAGADGKAIGSPDNKLSNRNLSERPYGTVAVGREEYLPRGGELTAAALASLAEKAPLCFVHGQHENLLRRLKVERRELGGTAAFRKEVTTGTSGDVLAFTRAGAGVGFVSEFVAGTLATTDPLVVRRLDKDLGSQFERLYLGVWWNSDEVEQRRHLSASTGKWDPVVTLLDALLESAPPVLDTLPASEKPGS
ncbi:MAG: LysR family transcriptional regulator [Gemmataceae bacterium]